MSYYDIRSNIKIQDCSLPDSMMQLDQLFKTTENERIKQTDNEILNESWVRVSVKKQQITILKCD